MARPKLGYRWHLRVLMAPRDMFATSDLVPRLAERGIGCRRLRCIGWWPRPRNGSACGRWWRLRHSRLHPGRSDRASGRAGSGPRDGHDWAPRPKVVGLDGRRSPARHDRRGVCSLRASRDPARQSSGRPHLLGVLRPAPSGMLRDLRRGSPARRPRSGGRPWCGRCDAPIEVVAPDAERRQFVIATVVAPEPELGRRCDRRRFERDGSSPQSLRRLAQHLV